jgi:enterobacterial common antigen flippase
MIGGAQAMSIAVGIVRTKAMAVLLGPSGVGLAGLYGSIADVVFSVAGMGVNSSGVRQIAEAVGSGDTDRIARTAIVLQRISVILGVLGAILLVAFSMQVSVLTFGSSDHVPAICLLAVSVFLRLVSAGQGALIQGMRCISDLAKMGVLGALFGTVITIPLVYFFGEDGVVPSLVAVAATTVATSSWYSRKIRIHVPSLTVSEIWQEASTLLKLGVAFMATGMMGMGAAYAIRLIVLRKVGFEAAGLYQSAWTLGGLYTGFILQAMGADFYPRLTAIATDDIACNRLVNEQALVGVLLAGPGVTATLTLAPIVVGLFYSADFGAAVGPLRWICLGMTVRVITWPLGFIVLAKGKQNLFFCTDLTWTVVHVGLAWICVKAFGIDGAGIAFFGSCLFHGFVIYPIVWRLSGFRWSADNTQIGLMFLALIGAVFCSFYVLPPMIAACMGMLAAALTSVYSVRALLRLVPAEQMPRPVRNFIARYKLAPSL